jgi:hypothetical protein
MSSLSPLEYGARRATLSLTQPSAQVLEQQVAKAAMISAAQQHISQIGASADSFGLSFALSWRPAEETGGAL